MGPDNFPVLTISLMRAPNSTLTEHRPDVLLNESREFECFLQTGVKGLLSNVVAIFEYNSSLATHIDHGFDMDHNALASPVEVLGRVRLSQLVSFFLRQSRRIVSVQRVMGRSLICNDIRND